MMCCLFKEQKKTAKILNFFFYIIIKPELSELIEVNQKNSFLLLFFSRKFFISAISYKKILLAHSANIYKRGTPFQNIRIRLNSDGWWWNINFHSMDETLLWASWKSICEKPQSSIKSHKKQQQRQQQQQQYS